MGTRFSASFSRIFSRLTIRFAGRSRRRRAAREATCSGQDEWSSWSGSSHRAGRDGVSSRSARREAADGRWRSSAKRSAGSRGRGRTSSTPKQRLSASGERSSPTNCDLGSRCSSFASVSRAPPRRTACTRERQRSRLWIVETSRGVTPVADYLRPAEWVNVASRTLPGGRRYSHRPPAAVPP
jgi:hypothetical protein